MQMLRKLDHPNVIKVFHSRRERFGSSALLLQLLDSFYTPDSKVAVLVFELMLADLGVSELHCISLSRTDRLTSPSV